MKAFLEEYSIIIIIAIVALLMVILATPLGKYIGMAIANTVTEFITKSGINNAPSWSSPF